MVDKDEVISDIIEYRVCDIEEFYEINMDNLDQNTRTSIERFLDKMEDNSKFNKKKKKEIKLIIYNNRDKLSKELIQNLQVII